MKTKIKFILNKIRLLLCIIPLYKKIYQTSKTQTPITFKTWFYQKILGFNKRAYWQMHHSSIVSNPQNILVGVETSPGFMPGCYIQGRGGIEIGDYTQISCNVGIISENHSFYDCRIHINNDKFPSVKIGKYCWIGMNCTILPSVELGNFTIVGAGSVVTKSFPDGYCIIAGNPAREIRKLNKEECVEYQSLNKYNGYIHNDSFDDFRKKRLKI